MMFTLLSWNVQGQQFRHGPVTKFSKILPYLQKQQADIICLQELTDAAEKLENLKQYQIFVPAKNTASVRVYGANHNVILSKFPIEESKEIYFPKNLVPAKAVVESASYSRVNIHGEKVHIYNCHFPIIDVGPKSRLKMLKYLFFHAPDNGEPIIFCGDFNVTIVRTGWTRKIIQWWHREPNSELNYEDKFLSEDERFIFNSVAEENKFKEVFELDLPTWSPFYTKFWELFKLKLDWVLCKNLVVLSAEMGPYISDHRPLVVKIKSCKKK